MPPIPDRLRLPAVILLLSLLTGACATMHSQVKDARELLQTGKFDQAVQQLQNAVRQSPRNSELRTLLFRAKVNCYFSHLVNARAMAKEGRKEPALKEYEAALAVFPDNQSLQEEIRLVTEGEKAQRPAPFQPTVTPPVQLKVKSTERISLKLSNTPIQNIFRATGRTFGINFVFDKDFRDFIYGLEVENAGFYEILNQLCMVAQAQYRVLDPTTLLIYPDQFAKRKAFDLRGIKTFYLQNIKAEDAKKLLVSIFRDEQPLIQEDPNLNAVIVRADINALSDMERFLANVDKEKREVELSIEILEINRTLISKLGSDYGDVATAPVTMQYGNLSSDNKISSVFKVKNLGEGSFYMTLPSVALSMLESTNNNKILAKPNMRGVDGAEMTFRVGDEVPVPETTFTSFSSTSTINNVPYQSYKYKNVGVEIKVTPLIHGDNEVTLKMKLTVNFLSGYTGEFPVFGTREIENTIRLREGETNLVGGLIRDDVRKSLSGIMALSRLPLIGSLFGSTDRESKQTDLIFSITPRIIRRLPLTPRNQEPIWSNLGRNSSAQNASADRIDSRNNRLDRPGPGIEEDQQAGLPDVDPEPVVPNPPPAPPPEKKPSAG